ncbi:MAG: hypothetical protein EOP85_15315 [Verrucomicrobiaceae bacterium]|nr:MAG: hypothetical protein EOP85_15315 [Verrucomicrobiaceae bacterium]
MNLLKDILTYAVRGSGKYLLLTCVVLSVVADLAGIAPLLGGIAAVLLSGYFCATYFHLIQSTATGGKEAPEFPETSNIFEDIIWPMLQIFIVALVSFGPGIAYVMSQDEQTGNMWVALGLLGAGVVYFPMAMLAVVVLGYSWALSPHIVLPAIFRAGWIYWLGVVMLGILYVVSTIVERKLSGQIIVSHLVMAVVGSYTMITNARILGVVYRERQEELGWL